MGQASIEQYNVYWVSLDPTRGGEMAKTRPCVIISPEYLNQRLTTVVVIPLTSRLRQYSFRVSCTVAGKAGSIAIDQVRVVDKSRVNTHQVIDTLSPDEIDALQQKISDIFCW